jgi:4-hydroxy-tetrahydrodipicolinate reductase
VACRRVVDFSPYGPDEMAHIGAGLTGPEFDTGARAGQLGHIGLLESAHMVATALGISPDRWAQTKTPVLADRRCVTSFVEVKPGRVRGFRQRVQGSVADDVVLDFEMLGLLDPTNDDPELGDSITIDAEPSVHLTVSRETAQRGGTATAGVATNLLGPVLAAEPGFLPLWRLPLQRSRSHVRLTSSPHPWQTPT